MRRMMISLVVAVVAVAGAMWTAGGAVAVQRAGQPAQTVCAMTATPFPAFGPQDLPGNRYGVLATGMTCAQAKRVAKQAIVKRNPGPGKQFTGPGAFSLCMSITPSTATKVFAGSCFKPGSTAVTVTWIPTCGDGPCKGLKR